MGSRERLLDEDILQFLAEIGNKYSERMREFEGSEIEREGYLWALTEYAVEEIYKELSDFIDTLEVNYDKHRGYVEISIELLDGRAFRLRVGHGCEVWKREYTYFIKEC